MNYADYTSQREHLVRDKRRAQELISDHPSDPGPAYKAEFEAKQAITAIDAVHPEHSETREGEQKARREQAKAEREESFKHSFIGRGLD